MNTETPVIISDEEAIRRLLDATGDDIEAEPFG